MTFWSLAVSTYCWTKVRMAAAPPPSGGSSVAVLVGADDSVDGVDGEESRPSGSATVVIGIAGAINNSGDTTPLGTNGTGATGAA